MRRKIGRSVGRWSRGATWPEQSVPDAWFQNPFACEARDGGDNADAKGRDIGVQTGQSNLFDGSDNHIDDEGRHERHRPSHRSPPMRCDFQRWPLCCDRRDNGHPLWSVNRSIVGDCSSTPVARVRADQESERRSHVPGRDRALLLRRPLVSVAVGAPTAFRCPRESRQTLAPGRLYG
jgi:hypothetical protein